MKHIRQVPVSITSSLVMESAMRPAGYSDYLKLSNIAYSVAPSYLTVGSGNDREGWLIHISVVRQQMTELMSRILPCLIHQQVAFSIPLDLDQHTRILDGRAGLENVAKVVNIQVDDNRQFNKILIELAEKTIGLKGPVIYDTISVSRVLYISRGNLNTFIQCPGIISVSDKSLPISALLKKIMSSSFVWPTEKTFQVCQRKPNRLIKLKYVPIQTLKVDPKGIVLKCIMIDRLINFNWCVLKLGEKFQSYDDAGRDIQDRLEWQYELHQNLFNKIRVPEAFELFSFGDKKALALQLIPGQSIGEYINAAFSGTTWNYMPKNGRSAILHQLVQILNITDKLHQLGFIHRDLNPENFIVTDHSEVYLLDLELCYSKESSYPAPAFALGTFGYMSPQQINLETPDETDDIYALGAILIRAFTGLSPLKFNLSDHEILYDQLYYFIDDEKACRLTIKCLNHDPRLRPRIKEILDMLSLLQSKVALNTNDTPAEQANINKETLDKTIGAGLATLLSSYYTDNTKCWNSTRTGTFSGIDGPFNLLVQAVRSGFELKGDQEVLDRNLEILESYLTGSKKAGIAIGVDLLHSRTTWLNLESAGLVKPDINLRNWLQHPVGGFDTEISYTISDLLKHGRVLTQYLINLPNENLSDQLAVIIEQLIIRQDSNGSWKFVGQSKTKKTDLPLSFLNGVAGIVSLLISYTHLKENCKVDNTVQKALTYLLRSRIKFQGKMIWPVSERSTETDPWLGAGFTGIAYVFIQAYDRYSNIIYKEAAVEALMVHPENISSNFIGLSNGLSGLAEVYLEAHRIFGDDLWQRRAHQVLQFLIHTGQETNGYRYWQADDHLDENPSMLFGHAGIVHCLLRASDPEHVKFPIFNF
ncbi:hypothetical protein A0256_00125 [Mucilaginibacter sp. PAMC 26640]|nr:hypothetical protein A0256_00125 [Mucilaginibacter sp. PAMC 26640]